MNSKQKDKYLQKKYGISLKEYRLILRQQNGKCAICRHPPKTRALNVDHDHKTGKVRGLLCYRCNKLLIGRHTNPEIFLKAYKYLKKCSYN